MDEKTVNSLYLVVAGYSIFLIVFGTIANAISFCVCLRKRLRKVPTFVFYAGILLSDTISLYFWNLDHYYKPVIGYEIEIISLFVCQLSSILQTLGLECSAWQMVAMTVERCLSAKIKTWRIQYFNSKTAAMTSGCIFIVIFTIVTYFGASIRFNVDNNQDINQTCYDSDYFIQLMQVQNFMYCFLPFGIMLIANTILIIQMIPSKTISSSNQAERSRKRRSTSISILVVTSVFMVFALPQSIGSAFYLSELYASNEGILLVYVFDSMVFTFHSSTFVLLMITNKQFRTEFKSMFSCFFARQENRLIQNTAANQVGATDNSLSLLTNRRNNTIIHTRG